MLTVREANKCLRNGVRVYATKYEDNQSFRVMSVKSVNGTIFAKSFYFHSKWSKIKDLYIG